MGEPSPLSSAVSQLEPFVAQLGVPVPEPLPDQRAIVEGREPTKGRRVSVPLENLVESKTNARKLFGDLKELGESIVKTGQLAPLIVREVADNDEFFEIVAGARRFRAMKLTKVAEADCLVRALTDAEVVEIQCVENVQRLDVHPLEEAQSYLNMLNAGWKAETVAARVAKSKAWVYGRMKLLALGPEARSTFLAGGLSLSVAIPLARRTHQAQAQILKTLGNRTLDARWAIEQIQHADRSLKSTPFDPKAELNGAPPCAKCPSNSLNQPRELFADYSDDEVGKHGICADVPCFVAKTEESFKEKAAALVAKGATLLDAEGLKRVMPNGYLSYGAPFVKTDDTCFEDTAKQRTWAQLAKDAPADKAPALLVAQDAEGKMMRFYKRTEALAAAAANGHAFAKRAQKPSDEESKKERAKLRDANKAFAQRQRIAHQALLLVAESIAKTGLSPGDLRSLLTSVAGEFAVGKDDPVLALFDMTQQQWEGSKVPEKSTEAQLGALLFVNVAGEHCLDCTGDRYPAALLEFTKRHGVDLKKLEQAQDLADRAEAEKKKGTKKPKTTKGKET